MTRPGKRPSSLLIAALLSIALAAASCSGLPVIAPPPEGLLTADEHLRLAAIYSSNGENNAAVKQIGMAVEAAPEDAAVRFRAGNLYLSMKDFKGAEEEYLAASKLEPANGAVRNNLAWVYLETGRHAEAEASAREALRLDPASSFAYSDTLGAALMKKGDLDGAEAALLDAERAAAARPAAARGLAEIYRHLVELYQRRGEAAKAAEAAEKLKGLDR